MTEPRTISTKKSAVSQNEPIRSARGRMVPRPYLPMVKAMEPRAPAGASRMIQLMIAKITLERFSMPREMGAPASPLACRPKPKRMEMSSTGRISLPVRALTKVLGMMASRNCTKPAWLWVAAWGSLCVENVAGSTCRPLPGWTTLTTIRPTSRARVVRTSK